ncbi:MAG: phosphoribosyl-ATP diphosphatase [Rhodospirillales bacterium]|nr:phosphoribosyl-ATP diphosphatase [Rhodospirillales bacterium]
MADSQTLDRLYQAILNRRGADPETSYTAKLFHRGRAKIAQKLGEEAIETVIEAMGGDKAKLAGESADLLYHLLVLWADAGVKPEDVYDVLAAREGTSGIAEKASRKRGKV